MRLTPLILAALLSTPGISRADSPVPGAAASATTPTLNPAAAAPATPASRAAEADAALEKRLVNQGYKVEFHRGEKMFCKRHPESGSRVEITWLCATAQQIRMQLQDARDQVDKAQRIQVNPYNEPVSGHGMGVR